jgi:hypothetical protein
MKHNCGGDLIPLNYEINLDINGFPLSVMVDGFQCNQCDEKVMGLDAALFVESEAEKVRMFLSSIDGTTTSTRVKTSPVYHPKIVSSDYFKMPVMVS